jgi:hypothetical protein
MIDCGGLLVRCDIAGKKSHYKGGVRQTTMTAAGVMMIDYVTFARGGGGGKRDQRFYNLNSWESLWRRPLYYYYYYYYCIHKRPGENIVITNKRLSGARASDRLLRGPFDTRPDYLQVCVRFGFL